jgi:hypothetical protein
MRIRLVVLVSLVLILTTGCGTTTYYWRNDNPSANWNSDLYECTKAHSTTVTAGGGSGFVGALSAAEVGSVRTDYAMRDLCLRSRGWYQASAPATGPPPRPVPAPPRSVPEQPTVKPMKACPDGQYWNTARGRCERIGG